MCDSNGDDGGACVHTVHILAKYIARTFSAQREREGYSAVSRIPTIENNTTNAECVCVCVYVVRNELWAN